MILTVYITIKSVQTHTYKTLTKLLSFPEGPLLAITTHRPHRYESHRVMLTREHTETTPRAEVGGGPWNIFQGSIPKEEGE